MRVIVRAAAVVTSIISPTLSAQSVQYRSPAGVEYRSQTDTGPIARAEKALAAEPRNIDRIIALGVAQSGARQFREAIETFTRGLAIAPNNALLLRWRGHRYLSVREFDRAMADLTRGAQLDSTIYGIWYHLGVLRFAKGDFTGASDAFRRALPMAPDSSERTGATDWLWMSLMRAGREAEATAMLARHPDSIPANNAYARRLKLYRGEIQPNDLFTPADTSDIQIATLSYGLGNWYLVRGDPQSARRWFERSVQSGGWPAFGFIVSEIELRRLGENASTLDSATAAAVTRLLAQFDATQSAMGKLNAAGRAALFSDDAIFLNAFGGRSDGRASIDSTWARMYRSTTFDSARIEIIDRKERLIAPGVVLVDHLECLTGQRGPNSGRELPPRATHITLILRRQANADWKIVYYRAGDLRQLAQRPSVCSRPPDREP